MRERLLLAACSIFLAQCAVRAPAPDAFAFAALGDTPYNEREEQAFVQAMQAMDAEPLAFVVHVGDFKAGGNSRCTDELYLRRKAQFESSAHPFVYTPGDNEWTDCRRKSNGGDDPIERLARLRQVFFTDARSMGRRRMPMEMQSQCLEAATPCRCGPFPENRRWEHGGVVFATINLQASNNNRGFDAANDREADCRDKANFAWLAQAEQRALGARALIILTQANLWDENPPTYRPYVDALVDMATRLRKPMLLVHGETHRFRHDSPFTDRSGTPVANPVRVEVYGSPFVGWVRINVDMARPEPFTIEPHLTAIVPPQR